MSEALLDDADLQALGVTAERLGILVGFHIVLAWVEPVLAR